MTIPKIEIKNPSKSWWPGDKRVEPFMEPVAEALDKYLHRSDPGWTDIYNRAYEAVYKAISQRPL